MIKRRQAGDTIVEVLVAIIVVTVVITAAYAASIRSQKSVQQAQEHTTALKLAEAQIESLNVESANKLSAIYGSPSYLFCFDPAASYALRATGEITNTALSPVTSPMPPPGTTLIYNRCHVSNGVDYGIAIERNGADPTYVYTVHIRWDSIQGTGQDEVTLAYKVDRPQ